MFKSQLISNFTYRKLRGASLPHHNHHDCTAFGRHLTILPPLRAGGQIKRLTEPGLQRTAAATSSQLLVWRLSDLTCSELPQSPHCSKLSSPVGHASLWKLPNGEIADLGIRSPNTLPPTPDRRRNIIRKKCQRRGCPCGSLAQWREPPQPKRVIAPTLHQRSTGLPRGTGTALTQRYPCGRTCTIWSSSTN